MNNKNTKHLSAETAVIISNIPAIMQQWAGVRRELSKLNDVCVCVLTKNKEYGEETWPLTIYFTYWITSPDLVTRFPEIPHSIPDVFVEIVFKLSTKRTEDKTKMDTTPVAMKKYLENTAAYQRSWTL